MAQKDRLSALVAEIKRRHCQEHQLEKISYRDMAMAMTSAGYPLSHTPLRQYEAKEKFPGPKAMQSIAGFTGQKFSDLERYLDGDCDLASYFSGRCEQGKTPIGVNDVILWIEQGADQNELVNVITKAAQALGDRLELCLDEETDTALHRVMKDLLSGRSPNPADLVEASHTLNTSQADLIKLIMPTGKESASV